MNKNVKASNGTDDGTVEVLVYDAAIFANKLIRISCDDVLYIRNVGMRKHIFEGKFKEVSDASLLPLADVRWFSEWGLNDFMSVLPKESFLPVGGEVVNLRFVKQYVDGVFYLQKGELRRMVQVGDKERKGVEGMWNEFLRKK